MKKWAILSDQDKYLGSVFAGTREIAEELAKKEMNNSTALGYYVTTMQMTDEEVFSFWC